MKKLNYIIQVVIRISIMLVMVGAYAGKPLWIFTPLTPTQKKVLNTGTDTVTYLVTNQSIYGHQLILQPQSGVTQTTPCLLGPKNSAMSKCTLTLLLTGTNLPAQGVVGGPVLCQAYPDGKTPNPNQCYQPSQQDSLKITVFFLKSNGSTCTNGLECQSNACIAVTHTCNFCSQSNECDSGNSCLLNGQCIAPNGGNCSSDAGCIAGSTCLSGKCKAPNGSTCNSHNTCQSNLCIGTPGKCTGAVNSASCTSNAHCQSNFCSLGNCASPNNTIPCTSSNQCQSRYCSPQGQCTTPNLGSFCTSSLFCQNSTCINNTCTATGMCTSNADCPNGEICAAGRCTLSCVPKTCSSLNVNCGVQGDGCGGATSNCGACTLPQVCGAGGIPSVCGIGPTCVPNSCAQLGVGCGIQANGCGQTQDCGVCPSGLTCGGGGVPSQCG